MQAGALLSIFFQATSGGCRRRRLNSLFGEWAEQRQDGLVAGWPKLAEGENKSGDTAKFESRRDLAMATPREGFSFYSSTETQRSSQPSEVGASRAIRRL
jgi:hypothetical protein